MHAEALKSEIDAWLASHPYGIYGEYEPGPPEAYVFRVRFLEPVPPSWAITLGDFAHNARSALDHLAHIVVLENNGGMDERTQFPVVFSPWEWEGAAARGIGNASERHKRLIESFQPYHRKDLFGRMWLDPTLDDPLAVLSRMNNIDKHSVLNATPAAIQSLGWDGTPVRDIASTGDWQVPEAFLEDGGVLLRVNIVSNGPSPELRIKRHERIEIRIQLRTSLPASVIVYSVPLVETMDAILEPLREIYQAFVSEFK